MKVFYDKKGKNGKLFTVENSETLKDGQHMFYKNPWSWEYPLTSLENGINMFTESKITLFTTNLSKLTIGNYMFLGCSSLSDFNSDLSSLTDGVEMFEGCRKLNTFITPNLSKLINASGMFKNDNWLTSFECENMSSLKDGVEMFRSCTKLNSFSSKLPNLKYGSNMFRSCSALTSFSSNLSSLTEGETMFYDCETLTTFISDLPSLTNGHQMFDGCSQLTTFSSNSSGSPVNLSSLTDGRRMFLDCSSLTSFNSRLDYIEDADQMFSNCTSLVSFQSSNFSKNTDNKAREGVRAWKMFEGCTNLVSFKVDSGKINDTDNMFNGCVNLTSFDCGETGRFVPSHFSTNLTFSGCKLNLQSLKNLIDAIWNYGGHLNGTEGADKKFYLKLGVDKNLKNNQEVIELLQLSDDKTTGSTWTGGYTECILMMEWN